MIYVAVTSRKEGFRRGGRAWSCGETYAELTDEQAAAVLAEPLLVAVEITAEQYAQATGIEPNPAAGKGAKSGKGAKA